MEAGQDLPITGVCVVSDPGKCPPHYTVIDKTYDRPEDADLWKDGLFTRRVMRYLCVERQVPTQTKDVLVDATLINEKDPIPPGFTVVEYTHDSREKATKKKCLCLRWMIPTMTSDAITELILLSRTQRRAPIGYTLVGELNNMCLCYKMGKVSSPGSSNQSTPSTEVQGYSAMPQQYSTIPVGSGLPYTMSPGSQGLGPLGSSATMSRTGPPEQSSSSLATGNVNPLSGIEWKMNPKYNVLMELQNVTIPEIRGKTLMDIENQYAYDFSVERSVSKTADLS
ncbi:multivesicular body subunit 12B [Aplysia californica]|uniref:Multivesicular body subunit 12B n=1 Tax=Aplysia californica TaxID=6500 RepID=A0ABM0K094_APLCA|nr:multivesicular body subunit 12B [Aplysia californica]